MSEPEVDLPSSPQERRENDRRKLIVDVRFDGGNATGIANTRDIGVGGLYMTTTAPLDTGAEIVMSLRIDERPMDLAGVVAYADPGLGVGVRFKDLSAEDLAFLTAKLGIE